ncbi:MAG TPA: pyridoxamine 5'-phosphate oxidase family protein, partial [Streptosporangiaceae bacterium]|nr:pyridoxamine 5'-phosphate oxidase family protein [Streptosporangiaceae bacterium]
AVTPAVTPAAATAVTPAAATAPPRSAGQRRTDVQHMLSTQRQLWLASAAGDQAHLIPLAFAWDGTTITMVTRRTSRTARNLRASGYARAAVGSPVDVVIIEGPVSFSEPAEAAAQTRAIFATLPLNPERVPGAIGVHLTPRRILAWRGLAEIADRTVMADGTWLG